MIVYAAGAVLWRLEANQLKVAVVHRGRYDDWSFAKGKVDPGESLPQTAVREIREETGLKIKLGVKLETAKYALSNGATKEVHYWAARVTDKAIAQSKFKPSEEVASVNWLSPDEARKKLSYEFDLKLLQRVEDLHTLGSLKTKPVIVQRHAKAMPRADWKNGKVVDDGRRPLLPEGESQAKALIPILKAFGVKRVISSPWKRCRDTVAPFAKANQLAIIERHQLSELGNKKGPRRTANSISDVIEDGRPSVICTHRPALPTILDVIARYGSPNQEILLHEGRALEPGSMMVVHLTAKTEGIARRIVSIETYSPVIATE